MVHILDTLNRLENKFDNLAFPSSVGSDVTPPSQHRSDSQSSFTPAQRNPRERDTSDEIQVESQRTSDRLTLPHKVILWPTIYMHLLNSGIPAASDLQYVLQEGTLWLVRREMAKHHKILPADTVLPSTPAVIIDMDGREQTHPFNVHFTNLTVQQIQEYSNAFFNTFNVLYPLLNRDSFMNDIVAKLMREGYGLGDSGSVLALLVFALGQVAVEGVFARPINYTDGQPSGFRGGSLQYPPGIAMFNEARRRLGFVAMQCTLENVQIMLLQAMYCEANARHLDFWRSASAASMACQVLIKCQPFAWNTLQGDLIKRAYWTCVLSEDFYHMDLDLPQTGIDSLQDDVPLPNFQDTNEQHSASMGSSEGRAHFHYHFLAMIALRRLIARIHTAIHESE